MTKEKESLTALVRGTSGSHIEARDIAGVTVLERLLLLLLLLLLGAGGNRERGATFHVTRETIWRTRGMRGRRLRRGRGIMRGG